MKMDGWEDYLHTSFYGEHVLFPGLRLTSFGTFTCAAFLAAALCLLERCVIASHTLSLSRCSMHAQFPHLRALAALVALPRRPPISLAQSALADGALRSRDPPTIVRLFEPLSPHGHPADRPPPAPSCLLGFTCFFP